jgi:hypothetical protein
MDKVFTFTDEKVIPNDTLRKLLEGTLESKINTSILDKDKVIDIELSKIETDSFILDDQNTSEENEETDREHSWHSLRKKLVTKEDGEIQEPFSNTILKNEKSKIFANSTEGNSLNELSEVKNYFKAISELSVEITKEVKKLSEHLSRKEEIRKSEENVLDSPLSGNDLFNSKLIFLLFGIMTLGLGVGLVLGVMLIKML